MKSLTKPLFKLALFSLLAACNSGRQDEPENSEQEAIIAPVQPQQPIQENTIVLPERRATDTSGIPYERTFEMMMTDITVDPKTKATVISGIITDDRYNWQPAYEEYAKDTTITKPALLGKKATFSLNFLDKKGKQAPVWAQDNATVYYGPVGDGNGGFAKHDYMRIDLNKDTSSASYRSYLIINESDKAEFPKGFYDMLDSLQLRGENTGEWDGASRKSAPYKFTIAK